MTSLNSNLINLTTLGKTFFIDLDGTIVRHNAYLQSGDELLEGVLDFWNNFSSQDVIIITTARSSCYREMTINFLNKNSLRFDHLIMDLPKGIRYLLNDNKPDGSLTAYAVNLKRDGGVNFFSVFK